MYILMLVVFSFAQKCVTNPIELELEPFQLHEFLNKTFKNIVWNGTWISDDTFIYKTEDGDINKVNAADLKQEQFLAASIFANYEKSTINLAPDQKYVLIKYNTKSVFRHSKTAQYAIYNTETKKYSDIASKRHIQYVRWAPVGSTLAYIEDNNIYYVSNPENSSAAIQITKDGIPGIFYNGVPDWVYEEEVLGTGYSLWFSPNGRRLAFATFNDNNVKEYQYFMYGDGGDIEHQYPKTVKIRYPKVGTPNPIVVVKYVDLEDSQKSIISLHDIIPKELVTDDHVLCNIIWATDTDVVSVSKNRIQNLAAITRCNVVTKKCKVEQSFEEEDGWLEIQTLVYNKNGNKSILRISQEEGDDHYKHLVLFDVSTQQTTRLTYGKRVVLSVLYWNEENDLVYYSSTIDGNPSYQHTHVVNVKTLEDKCLTCNWKTSEGLCKVAITFPSKACSYCSKVCSGPGPTLIEIEKMTTQESKTWEENLVLRNQLKKKMRPTIKDINILLESGFTARARLWLPPNLKETSKIKYPTIVDVYGGPNSNRIDDSFTTGIVNYFTTNRGYVYIQIDGRGSGRNGDNLLFQIYRRLGTVEIEDQIAVAKYIKTHYTFIDGKNIGIWGWSYGGFSTIWSLIQDTENIFKFGLSVAPVTSYIFYDSIYTERYMGLPTAEDNLVGYNNTDTTLHVENLRNKSFFLIHGNADDNVHYQQSMALAKALEQADIMFHQQSYPDENHGLGGVLPHLYHTIDNFFAEEFQQK